MSREAFEKWARGAMPHELTGRALPSGVFVYSDAHAYWAWRGWQASSRESEALLRRAVEAMEHALAWVDDEPPRPVVADELDAAIAALRQHLEAK